MSNAILPMDTYHQLLRALRTRYQVVVRSAQFLGLLTEPCHWLFTDFLTA